MKKRKIIIAVLIFAVLSAVTVFAAVSPALENILDGIVGKTAETSALDFDGNGEVNVIDAILEEKGAEVSVYPSNSTVPASLKILSVGSSFSVDGLTYVYQIAKSMGVKDVVLGNMYIGGCTLDMHYQHAVDDDEGAYTYYKNTDGNWTETGGAKFSTCIKDEDWDVITFQQGSKVMGYSDSYSNLSALYDIVDGLKTNENVRYFWHFTWASASSYTYVKTYYNNSQMYMYTSTRDCVLSVIVPSGKFAGIIPSGTAIQNARTSFVGDNLNRDGHHLDLTLGRYIAGLSYYAAITGNDISDIDFVPSIDITTDAKNLAIESVTNAMKYMYSVTDSQYKEGTWTPASDTSKLVVAQEDCYEYDKYLASTVGVDLDSYSFFEYDYVTSSNYYSPSGTTPQVSAEGTASYGKYIRTEDLFTQADLPLGSVIICDAGWKYRPEKWVSIDSKTTNRPAAQGSGILVLDEAFWGDYTLLGLNIYTDPVVDCSEYSAAGPSHVRINIPNDK